MLLYVLITVKTLISKINWVSGNWAMNCDIVGSHFGYIDIKGELCSSSCENTPNCTHYTWNNLENSGRCFFKSGYIDKTKATKLATKFISVCGFL